MKIIILLSVFVTVTLADEYLDKVLDDDGGVTGYDEKDISEEDGNDILQEITSNVESTTKSLADIIEEQARIVRSKRLVFIETKDLESILSSKRPLQFQNQTYMQGFLTEFKQFLIPFYWFGLDRNRIMMTTAVYNQRNFAINSVDSIHLFVAFQPRDDITDDIIEVIDAVNKANQIYPGTVSTVILNYGYLQLDRQSLLLVNHEIRKVNEKIKQHPNANLKFGLQLDIMNCQNRREYIKGLEVGLVDLVVLASKQESTDVQNEQDFTLVILMNLPCLEFPQFRSIIVTDTQIEIEIDLENNLYQLSRYILEEMIEEDGEVQFLRGDHIKAVLFSAVVEKQTRVNASEIEHERMTEDSLKLLNWLHQSVEFNMLYFGAAIGTNDHRMANLVSHNFRKIIIRCCEPSQDNSKSLEQMLRDLVAHYVVKKDEDIPLQITLLITIDEIDFEMNKKQVDSAILALMSANQLVAEAVTTIMFDWVPCSLYESCSGFTLEKTGEYCSYMLWYQELSELFTYTEQALEKMVNTSKNINMEVVLDAQAVYKLLTIADIGCYKYLVDVLNTIQKIKYRTCKVVVLDENVREHGAVKISNAILSDLNHCDQTLSFNKREVTVHHYVQIVGCSGNYSSATQLTQLVRLYESLNIWAGINNKVVYVEAGFENPVECQQKKLVSSFDNCKCGWWVATNNTVGNKLSSITVLSKKTLALKLHRNNWNSHFSPRPAPGSTKTVLHTEVLLWILVPSLCVMVFIVVITVVLVLHYQSKYIMTKQEVATFLKGQLQKGNHYELKDGSELAQNEAYNSSKYELEPSAFKIDKSSCLGSGEFGKIFLGSINRGGIQQATAVKVTNVQMAGKSHGGRLALTGLLSEIKILSYLGQHNHIVSLLGACTRNMRKGDIVMFLELCELGSLYKYLRSIKPQKVDEIITEYEEDIPLMSIVNKDNVEMEHDLLDKDLCNELYKYAGQVACGMEFLTSKNVVHADLAARNILLTRDKVAKISDFGLSRRLYDYTEYVRQNQAPMPWRWMAPESLRRMVFNEKTDVWAFGVTLWEIFTLGDEPYPGLSWQVNFPSMLMRGLRPDVPRYNVKQIYSVMQRCWSSNSVDRPTFAELNLELNEI